VSRIVGIDLGTTNSLVASMDGGIPFVIADRDGARLTPSVVHVAAPGATPLVGHAAQRMRALDPQRTVSSVKRLIGRRGADLAHEALELPYAVRGAGMETPSILLPGRSWTPEEISAEILKKLKADAATTLGEEITRAVITVPAYFNDAQRNATKRAGELAGFTVERIIHEPTAAALAFGLDRLHERSRVAVYDLGGGTFDLSVLELNQGVFEVLATRGDTRLGGDDIDQRMAAWLEAQIAAAGGPIRSRDAHTPAELVWLARVRAASEEIKIRLSTETAVEIQLPFLTPEFSFAATVTRADLERLSREILERTRAHCVHCLADAKLEAKDLDQVILVGGQTRMPLVRQLVADWFNCAPEAAAPGASAIAGRPQLNTWVNPEEAVALGAAIQAEILAGGCHNLLLLDVTPLSLGIETFGGLMQVIIPRNSTIPTKAGEMFTTAVDHQQSVLIHVLQGERERARDNWSLGTFRLDFEAAPRGIPRVGVQFEIDANGILHVLARDVRTGRQQTLEIKSSVDVADAQVQQMLEASLDHAFDDLEARRWIEAKLRAEATLEATLKTLQEAGTELNAAARARIDAASATARAALATEAVPGGVGDVARLRAAIQTLDDATLPLAELIMDHAMARLAGAEEPRS
jgi:molecular chaperone DnaK